MFDIGDKVDLHCLVVVAVSNGKVTLEAASGLRFEVAIGDLSHIPEPAPFKSGLAVARRRRRG
jgi:hypothetical protein